MTHKIRNRKWRIVWKRSPGGYEGETHYSTRTLYVSPHAPIPDVLDTLIHETLHAALPDLSEEAVSETAQALSKLLCKTFTIERKRP